MRWFILVAMVLVPVQAFGWGRGGGGGRGFGGRGWGGPAVMMGGPRGGGFAVQHVPVYGYPAGYRMGGGWGRRYFAPLVRDAGWRLPVQPNTTVYRGNPDPPFVPYFSRLAESRPALTAPAPTVAHGPEYISIRIAGAPARRRAR